MPQIYLKYMIHKSQLSTEKKRRTFNAVSLDEISYLKNPRMTFVLQIWVHKVEKLNVVTFQVYTEIDTIWMISHALQLLNVPMLVGYNSLIIAINRQVISYLTKINSSPTNISIVL